MIPARDMGIAIATLRGDRHQATVARRAGIDPATWSLYERGKRRPREEQIDRICRGLQCSRLDLEETAWRARKERLVYEERQQRKLTDEGEPVALRRPDREPLRHEVRAALARFSAAAEDLLVFVLRERP